MNASLLKNSNVPQIVAVGAVLSEFRWRINAAEDGQVSKTAINMLHWHKYNATYISERGFAAADCDCLSYQN